MTLRFEVDQAEAFRRGINLPKSTIHLDVDPSKLSAEERNLIADRLNGIDVCKMVLNPTAPDFFPTKSGDRIQAKDPTYEALLIAVKEDAKKIEEKRKEIQEKRDMAKAATEALYRAGSRNGVLSRPEQTDAPAYVENLENSQPTKLASGSKETCPSCHELTLQLVRVEEIPPHPQATLGKRVVHYKCSNCQKQFNRDMVE